MEYMLIYLLKMTLFKMGHKYSFCHSRPALTLIELVFVIVTVGILAAVAIPKFAQTANNAKIAMDVSNMGTCIRESASYYALYHVHLPLEEFPSTCDHIKCFTISSNDTNFTVATNSTADVYCTNVIAVGGHLAKSYRF